MKILRVIAPGSDPSLQAAMGEAITSFNRGVDIRLRFLSIHVDQVELIVDEPGSAAARVDEAITLHRPAVALLDGDGETALASAAACVRRGVPLARLRAGRRDGADADAARGVDRLAGQLLTLDDAAHGRLVEEGLADKAVRIDEADPVAVGTAVIRALRGLRARPGGGD